MPALKPTTFTAEIVWLGRVADRAASLAAEPLESVTATFAGVAGEEHGGLTRPSCSRVLSQYPRDTEIRNVRQFSILSQEELDLIAADMGLDRIDPALVGASMVLKGIPDFTHVPPSSRLQSESGTTLVVDMENRPCQLPARVIEDIHAGKGKLFKGAAVDRRGVTAWVEREGTLAVGQTVTLHIPDQPVWAHLDDARAE